MHVRSSVEDLVVPYTRDPDPAGLEKRKRRHHHILLSTVVSHRHFCPPAPLPLACSSRALIFSRALLLPPSFGPF